MREESSHSVQEENRGKKGSGSKKDAIRLRKNYPARNRRSVTGVKGGEKEKKKSTGEEGKGKEKRSNTTKQRVRSPPPPDKPDCAEIE